MRATRLLVGVVAALTLVSGVVLGQHRRQPKGMMDMPRYDAATEVTLHGTVQKVEEVDQKNCPGCAGGIHLWVDSDGKSYEVHLGPSAFLKETDWSFQEGEELELTGSKVATEEGTSILAREVKKGGEILTLRDKDSIPAWSQRKRN